MLVRKLAVPLINEKILQQAEHCYIATAGMTATGFDFIRSRIPPKCPIDLVTGLDATTSPSVLRRILSNYQGRINLKVYTRNVINANVYIFDQPFRKTVAFTGSGTLTSGGLKDNEEVFWKITAPKEIESLLSWFTGYFEFGMPLTEELIREYEAIYPELLQNDVAAVEARRNALSVAAVNLETVRFRTQFFQKDDYVLFAGAEAGSMDPKTLERRLALKGLLQKLVDSVNDECGRLSLYQLNEAGEPLHTGFAGRINAMSVGFGKNISGFNPGMTTYSLSLDGAGFSVNVVFNGSQEYSSHRLRFRDQLQEPAFRAGFFNALTTLGPGGYFKVAGVRKPVEFFRQENLVMEFLQNDEEMILPVSIGRSYPPGDSALATDKISAAVLKDLKALKAVARFVNGES